MDIRRILTFALLWLPMAVVAQAPGAERHERGGRVDLGERIVSQPDSAAIIINLVNPPDSVADDGALPEPVKRYSPETSLCLMATSIFQWNITFTIRRFILAVRQELWPCGTAGAS